MRMGLLTGDDGWGAQTDAPAASDDAQGQGTEPPHATWTESAEIRDHDRRYPDCPGKEFVYGGLGGLICTECGR